MLRLLTTAALVGVASASLTVHVNDPAHLAEVAANARTWTSGPNVSACAPLNILAAYWLTQALNRSSTLTPPHASPRRHVALNSPPRLASPHLPRLAPLASHRSPHFHSLAGCAHSQSTSSFVYRVLTPLSLHPLLPPARPASTTRRWAT